MPTATVEKIEGSTARVSCQSNPRCDSCEAIGCVGAVETEIEVEIPENTTLSVGDEVEITPEREIMWHVGALLFLLPLLLFIGGIFLGHWFAGYYQLPLTPETSGFLLGLLLILLCSPLIRKYGNKLVTEQFVVQIKN